MRYDYLPYAVVEFYCLLFTITILLSLNSNLGSEHEVRQLKNMIYSFMTMLVTDILWALMQDNLIHLPVLIDGLVNAISIMAISGGCYFWFRFIEDRSESVLLSKKRLDLLVAVPLYIICVLDLISIFTGWMFYIDVNGHYVDNSLFWLQTVVNYGYLIIPTIVSVIHGISAKSAQERSEYRTYALYMILPLIAGILEVPLKCVPLLAINIFMMILIVFMKIQNLRISNDALTGLNNRRKLDSYLEEILQKASVDNPVTVFIMDIDYFKSINDKYGHLEGDHALQLFSDTLKGMATRYGGFAARYGGDEFCLIIQDGKIQTEEII